MAAQQKAADAAERAAAAAEWQINPTWAQVGFAFAGTLLLIVTVIYTVRTYRLTLRATQVQLRAYLAVEVEDKDATVGNVVNDGPNVFHGPLKVTNVGESWAFEISVIAAVQVHNETGVLIPMTPVVTTPAYFHEAPKNDPLRLKMLSAPLNGLETHGNLVMTLKVALSYQDAFKTPYVEERWMRGSVVPHGMRDWHQIPDPDKG